MSFSFKEKNNPIVNDILVKNESDDIKFLTKIFNNAFINVNNRNLVYLKEQGITLEYSENNVDVFLLEICVINNEIDKLFAKNPYLVKN
jgi:hypothetical protein